MRNRNEIPQYPKRNKDITPARLAAEFYEKFSGVLSKDCRCDLKEMFVRLLRAERKYVKDAIKYEAWNHGADDEEDGNCERRLCDSILFHLKNSED
jgi:hypothetical protein